MGPFIRCGASKRTMLAELPAIVDEPTIYAFGLGSYCYLLEIKRKR